MRTFAATDSPSIDILPIEECHWSKRSHEAIFWGLLSPHDREGSGNLEDGKSEDLPSEIVANCLPGLRRLR